MSLDLARVLVLSMMMMMMMVVVVGVGMSCPYAVAYSCSNPDSCAVAGADDVADEDVAAVAAAVVVG